MPDRTVPRRRGLFWSAVVAALLVLVGGSTYAYVTYAATDGLDGAVKGYFAALARGSAPAALGFGELPPGPHELLTSKVLALQRKLAPIRHVHITGVQRSGDEASVGVRYDLAFADGAREVSDHVRVVRHDGSWRLARTAAVTQLSLAEAKDRATILGAAVPDGDLLVFPGAVPITFDTPYLRLSPATRSVALSAPDDIDLSVEVTAGGRAAAEAAVVAALRNCLAGGAAAADPRRPVPSDRAVPGTLRASFDAADVRRDTKVALAATARGLITISGRLTLNGRYTALDFENQPTAKAGPVSLPLHASAHPTAPLTLTWTEADR
jgi:hypothetical protein